MKTYILGTCQIRLNEVILSSTHKIGCNTANLQWLKHLWNHEKMFEAEVVRAKEC